MHRLLQLKWAHTLTITRVKGLLEGLVLDLFRLRNGQQRKLIKFEIKLETDAFNDSQ